jgi:hypothetical protein
MQEYLFRGKTYNGVWVEGAVAKMRLFSGEVVTVIVPLIDGAHDFTAWVRVIPESVEQFTGLTDWIK